MASQMLPQKVADAFAEQYYVILEECPENLHKFYQESSLLAWPGPDGVITPVTTLSVLNNELLQIGGIGNECVGNCSCIFEPRGINAKIMSSDHKSCLVEIKTVDALKSLEGGFIVAITGLIIRKDTVKKSFSQTFILAKQEKGFFVLNDILRFCNIWQSVAHSASNNVEKSDQAAASVQSSVPSNTSYGHASNTNALVHNGNAKGTLDISVTKDSDTVHSVLAPGPNVEVESPKLTYASMVAKESSVTYSKTQTVPSIADSHAIAPSTENALTPRGNSASKASAPPSNVAPMLPISSNSAPYGSAYAEARAIYIGGLPYNITKQGVVDIVKRFGPVRRNSDSIQIRIHADGFCFGFVEFESEDAALRAVEAHHVKFGEKKAFIMHKRSFSHRGYDGRGRSPTRGGYQNGCSGGREVTGDGKGQSRGPRHSGPSNQWFTEETGWH